MTNYFDNKTAFLAPQVDQYGSRFVMSNVTKPRKTKLINIDTRFMDSNSRIDCKKENYMISLPERITEATSIKVSQIEIPMTIFNISSSLGNNYFTLKNITLDASDLMTIPDGNYSNENMDVILNNITKEYEISFKKDDNNFLTIINNSSSSYMIDFATDQNGLIDKQCKKSNFGWILGFRSRFYTLSTMMNKNYQQKAEAIMNMNTIRYLYLVIDEFSNTIPNSFCSVYSDSIFNKKILGKIVMNNVIYPFGTILIGNEENAVLMSDKRIYSGKTDLQKLNIELVNEFGKSVNLNGTDFSFILKIEHE